MCLMGHRYVKGNLHFFFGLHECSLDHYPLAIVPDVKGLALEVSPGYQVREKLETRFLLIIEGRFNI